METAGGEREREGVRVRPREPGWKHAGRPRKHAVIQRSSTLVLKSFRDGCFLFTFKFAAN